MTRKLRAAFLLLLNSVATGQGLDWTEFADTAFNPPDADGNAAGDIDGDGFVDVVTASQGLTGPLKWSRNPGPAGGLWVERTIEDVQCRGPAVADLDGDGDQDVIALNGFSFRLWQNLGSGTSWSASSPLGILAGPSPPLLPTDIDGDGDLDVLARSGATFGVRILENVAGDASQWTKRLAVFGTNFDVADIDADGDLDLYNSAVDLEWGENLDARATQWQEHLIEIGSGVSVLQLAAGDFDADGSQDVFGTDPVVNGELFLNEAGDGSAFRRVAEVANFGSSQTPLAADLDVDGDLDLALLGPGAAVAYMLENVSGDGAVWAAQVIADVEDDLSIANLPVAADFDGDGRVDLAFETPGTQMFTAFSSTPRRRFVGPVSEAPITSFLRRVAEFEAADIDGDGDTDGVWVDPAMDLVGWWRNDGAGNGSFEVAVIPRAGANDVAVLDLDADGDFDLVSSADAAGKFTLAEHLGQLGADWAIRDIANGAGPSSVAGGDLDGDGDVDVLGGDAGANELLLIENLAGDASAWTTTALTSLAFGVQDVALTDVDGDGDLDVVAVLPGVDVLGWLENDRSSGAPVWRERFIANDVQGATRVQVADGDQDGDADLLAAGGGSSALFAFENVDGTGSFWSRALLATLAAAIDDIEARDLDQDGDLDVVLATPSGIHWVENAARKAWFLHGLSTQDADAVATADLDGDLDLDLLVGSLQLQPSRLLNDATDRHYGFGLNPLGSLDLVGGGLGLTESLVLAARNPLGTQADGSLSSFAFSLAPAPGFPNGVLLQGLGMAGPGAPGELLVDLAPGSFLPPVARGTDWSANAPAYLRVAIPNDASLVGLVVYAQAVLVDPQSTFGVRTALTSALALVLVEHF